MVRRFGSTAVALSLLVCALFSVTYTREARACYRNDTKLLGIGALALALDAVLRKENSLLPQGIKTLKALRAWAKSLPKRGHWHDIKKYLFTHKVKMGAAALLVVMALLKSTTIANWSAAEMPGVSGFKPGNMRQALHEGAYNRTVDDVYAMVKGIYSWRPRYYTVRNLERLPDQKYVLDRLNKRNREVFSAIKNGKFSLFSYNVFNLLMQDTVSEMQTISYMQTLCSPATLELLLAGIKNKPAFIPKEFNRYLEAISRLFPLLKKGQVSVSHIDALFSVLKDGSYVNAASLATKNAIQKMSDDDFHAYFSEPKLEELFRLTEVGQVQASPACRAILPVLDVVCGRLSQDAVNRFFDTDRINALIQSSATCSESLNVLDTILAKNPSQDVLNCFDQRTVEVLGRQRENIQESRLYPGQEAARDLSARRALEDRLVLAEATCNMSTAGYFTGEKMRELYSIVTKNNDFARTAEFAEMYLLAVSNSWRRHMEQLDAAPTIDARSQLVDRRLHEPINRVEENKNPQCARLCEDALMILNRSGVLFQRDFATDFFDQEKVVFLLANAHWSETYCEWLAKILDINTSPEIRALFTPAKLEKIKKRRKLVNDLCTAWLEARDPEQSQKLKLKASVYDSLIAAWERILPRVDEGARRDE